MKKPTWLKKAIAKEDGFYNAKGEKLKCRRLTAEFIAEWNGTAKPKAKAKPAPAPKVEKVVEVEIKEEAPKPVAKKTSTKKKKSGKLGFGQRIQKAVDNAKATVTKK